MLGLDWGVTSPVVTVKDSPLVTVKDSNGSPTRIVYGNSQSQGLIPRPPPDLYKFMPDTPMVAPFIGIPYHLAVVWTVQTPPHLPGAQPFCLSRCAQFDIQRDLEVGEAVYTPSLITPYKFDPDNFDIAEANNALQDWLWMQRIR